MKTQRRNNVCKMLLTILFFAKGPCLFAQDSTIKGKKIFQTHCGSCHSVHHEIVGPALASITKKRNPDWLIPFVKNSQQVIASGDEYANHLAEQYSHMVMPSFKLSDTEIKNVLHYIEMESKQVERELNDIDLGNNNDIDVLRGRDLFLNQCASCHSIKLENYGPALGSVTRRRPRAWLINFIKNSQQVIQTDDPYSISLFENFDKKIMVSMEFLSDSDIDDILKYIEHTSNYLAEKSSLNMVPASRAHSYVESKSTHPFFIVFFILIALLGAVVQGLLITKLYNHLSKRDTLA